MLVIPGATVQLDSWGGNCPVQGYGTITVDGGGQHDRYFRARGESWSVTVGRGVESYVSDEDAELVVEGLSRDQRPFQAGYMSEAEGREHLTLALTCWAEGKRGLFVLPGDSQ